MAGKKRPGVRRERMRKTTKILLGYGDRLYKDHRRYQELAGKLFKGTRELLQRKEILEKAIRKVNEMIEESENIEGRLMAEVKRDDISPRTRGQWRELLNKWAKRTDNAYILREELEREHGKLMETYRKLH